MTNSASEPPTPDYAEMVRQAFAHDPGGCLCGLPHCRACGGWRGIHTREALRSLLAGRDRLRAALEALVRLQAHYAGLLNQYDGGQRTEFASADDWLSRLDELQKPEKPR